MGTAHLPPWRTCPTAAEPQGPTYSLISTCPPSTLPAFLFPHRLLWEQTNMLCTRKSFWFWATISSCPRGIQKTLQSPLLFCKGPSPHPSWAKHKSPAVPRTNMILPDTIKVETATTAEFLLFSLSGLLSSKVALSCNSYRDAKGNHASIPSVCFLPLFCRVGMLKSIFLYLPSSEKSKKYNSMSFPFRQFFNLFPDGFNRAKWLAAGADQLEGQLPMYGRPHGLDLQEKPAILWGPSSTSLSTACVAAEDNNKYFV